MRTGMELTAELRKVRAEAKARKVCGEQAVLDCLREQVEMRTRGLQWVECRTLWGSKKDEEVGTVPELTGHLKEILNVEQTQRAAGELPTHAPAPIMKRKSFKQLGSPTAQVTLSEGWGCITVCCRRGEYTLTHSPTHPLPLLHRRWSLLISAVSYLRTSCERRQSVHARGLRPSRPAARSDVISMAEAPSLTWLEFPAVTCQVISG